MISVVLANPTFIVNFADPLTIVTFVVLTVLAVLINLFSFYEFRRWLPRIVILSLTGFSIIAYIFLLSLYALIRSANAASFLLPGNGVTSIFSGMPLPKSSISLSLVITNESYKAFVTAS